MSAIPKPATIDLVMLVVTGAWVADLMLGALIPGYHAHPEATTVFISLIGAGFLGKAAVKVNGAASAE